MPTTYVSRLSSWIEKRFNAKGGNVITDVDSSARAVMVFDGGVEDRYLKAWDTYQTNAQANAVAAQFGRVQIRNPVGSNVVGVLEQAIFNAASGSNLNAGVIRPATVDLANVQTGLITAIDGRSRPASSLIVSFDTNASGSPGAFFAPMVWNSQPNTPGTQMINTVDQEIMILPGNAYFFIMTTVNITVIMSLRWRERALEQSELT